MNLSKSIAKYRGFKEMELSHGCIVFMQAILVNLLLQIVASIVFSIITLATGIDATKSGIANIIFMIFIQLGYGLVLFFNFYVKKRKLRYSTTNTISTKSGLLALVLFALTFIGFYLVGTWVEVFLSYIKYNGMGGLDYSSPIMIILSIFAACILAPIFEEAIFRGALLSGLKNKFGTIVSILLSGLAFSLMHMNPQQTVYQFVLGCVCAYATIKSESLWPAIFIHAINNIFAILLDLTILGDLFIKLTNSIMGNLGLFISLTFILSIGCGVAIWLVGRFIKQKKSKSLTNNLSEKDNQDSSQNTSGVILEIKPKATRKFEGEILSNNNESIDNPTNDIVIEKHNADALPEGGILGKATSTITYIAGVAICLVMWVIVFISSI